MPPRGGAIVERGVGLALVLVVALASLVPCDDWSGRPDHPAADLHGGHGAHAAHHGHGGGGPEHLAHGDDHQTPVPSVTARCQCGCQEPGAASAGIFKLDVAVLDDEPTRPDPPEANGPVRSEAAAPEGDPTHPDHVPIAA